ncbi:iron ABC transporter permease [uncultured Dialister sp.]|uniref:ABC transporter permease n=1 Tax=uncultured Dialister sp. TaxID=278064 RepID=UPI002609E4DE|nr:iron ABC transporter permease [uncultured Dialister sp.]
MNGQKKISLSYLLLAGLLLFLILCPLLTIFVKAFIINDELNVSYALSTILEPQNGKMIRNSLLLGGAVVILATLISLPLSYLFSRTSLAEHRFFDILFLIPFMTPPYIASMGWILFMQKRGLLSQLCPALTDGIPLFFSFGGLVLVMSLHIFPFMLVLMKNAMLRIPSSLEEAAAVSGAGYGCRLRKIFFPLLTGNYVIGALLVFVKTLSEYGTPYTLGKRIGFDVFTTDIHRYAAIAPIDFGKAAVLASLLVTICLLLWLVQNYITATHSYGLIGGKGSRMKYHVLSPVGQGFAILYILLVFAVSVGIPYFSVISTSLIKLRGFGLAAGNFTLAHYTELFTESDAALSALGNSFFLGITSATLCALLGTVIVLTVRQIKGNGGKLLEAISLIPEMLPGIVLVIGLMLFWNDIYDFLPLYNTLGIMVITYTALFLPYTVQYVTSASSQLSESLLEAGRIFGASRWYIFRHITCPLIARGIAAGWMMTFIIAVRELVAPSLIAPPDTLVISTFIMREFEQGSVSLGMSMAVLCILFTTISLFAVKRFASRLK